MSMRKDKNSKAGIIPGTVVWNKIQKASVMEPFADFPIPTSQWDVGTSQ